MSLYPGSIDSLLLELNSVRGDFGALESGENLEEYFQDVVRKSSNLLGIKLSEKEIEWLSFVLSLFFKPKNLALTFSDSALIENVYSADASSRKDIAGHLYVEAGNYSLVASAGLRQNPRFKRSDYLGIAEHSYHNGGIWLNDEFIFSLSKKVLELSKLLTFIRTLCVEGDVDAVLRMLITRASVKTVMDA